MDGHFAISRTITLWVPIGTSDKDGQELNDILESEVQAFSDWVSADLGDKRVAAVEVTR